ncbi:MAG: HEAT repeat domain-containing protein [Nitrososphaerales archaeon]
MIYTETIEDKNRERAFRLLAQMEVEYEKKNASFFNQVLSEEPSLVVRVHAVTVLSEIGDESSVPVLGDVMKHDPSSLIRHECAFSLGQLGLKSSVPYLVEACLNDPSEIVRHESAAALGAIGDEKARPALEKASQDESDEVRGSALASLFNLDFLKYSKNSKIDPLVLSSTIEEKKKNLVAKKMPHP